MLTKPPSYLTVVFLAVVFVAVCRFTWHDLQLLLVFGGTSFVVFCAALYAWADDQHTSQIWRGRVKSDDIIIIESLPHLSVYDKLLWSYWLTGKEQIAESILAEAQRIEKESAMNSAGLTFQQVSELLVAMKPGDQLPAQNGNPRRDELAKLAKWLIDKNFATGGPSAPTVLIKSRREILEQFRKEVVQS